MIKSEDLVLHTLCENSVSGSGVSGEWGYSMLIEAGGKTILFDTGSSGIASTNAARMGLHLSDTDLIVLSHGHYDHTGGLPEALARINKAVPIVAHPDVFGLKYSYNKKKDSYRFVGIPHRREQLESLGGRFEFTTEPRWITEDIATSGEEPMTTEYETIPESLCIKSENGYLPDPMTDDLSIFIRTELGLVVILGCAHRGIINIIRHGMKVMQTDDLYMVLGGTHLVTADKRRLEKTIEALTGMRPRWIGASHCTGFTAAATMYGSFPDIFFVNNTGTVITFPFEG